MNWGYVPSENIIAMIITSIICFGLPIVLLIVFKKKGGWLPAFFVGCGTFVVFALVLEQIVHTVVLANFGTVIRQNVFLTGLYGGLAAALFEETGRLIAFRFLLKKHRDSGTALMYGAGHGGIEAMLIVGLTYINNIATSIMINSGNIEQALSSLDESTRQATFEQISELWTSSAGVFLLGGVERILAMILQITLSMLVYMAVKNGKKSFWALAFVFHFLVDCITVVLASYVSVIVVEIILAVMVAGIVCMTGLLYRNRKVVIHP